MKNQFLFIILIFFVFGCGSNQFAKRKYTKGVYVEKREHHKSQKTKNKKEDYKAYKNKAKQNENTLGQKKQELAVKIENKVDYNPNYDTEKNNEIDAASNIEGEFDIHQKQKSDLSKEENIIPFEGESGKREDKNVDPLMLPFWVGTGLTGFSIALFAILCAIFSNIPWIGVIIGLAIASATFVSGSVFFIISGSKVHSKSRESNGKTGKYKFFSFLYWFGFVLLIISLAMLIYTLADGFPLFGLMIALPVALVGIALVILGFFLLKNLKEKSTKE